MDSNAGQDRKSFSTMEGILLMVGFVLVSVVFASFVGLVSNYDSRVALPMLSIAGIVLLLICLTGVSYVFARAGLQNNNEALGLPAGSIQSVIALSLIVLFAILSVFLFSSIGGSTRELKNLSAADRDGQIARLGSSFAGWEQQEGTEKYTIFVRDPGIDARNDVGKQLIVLIGTLMTSAVSFYFGSRATASGAAAVGGQDRTAQPTATDAVISTVEPSADVPRGQPTTIKVTGSGLGSATGLSVRQAGAELGIGDFRTSATEISFTLSPSATAAPGSYDLVILANAREIATRPNALTLAP